MKYGIGGEGREEARRVVGERRGGVKERIGKGRKRGGGRIRKKLEGKGEGREGRRRVTTSHNVCSIFRRFYNKTHVAKQS